MGIDIGTSGVKVVVITEEGGVKGSALIEYGLDTPRPGWAEQDPEDWWRANVAVIQSALQNAAVPGREITAIGLTGQMHGSVFLDRDDRVIRPALLWCDQRTAGECEEILSRVGFARAVEWTANPVLTGFTAPKILWLRGHEPENYEKIRKILLPKDYIRFRITGEYATDVSDASGTSLFDVKNRKWSEDMLRALDIPMAWMPDCYESPDVAGFVTKEASGLLGIPEGTPVVAGAGDQAAGGVGNGIVERGVLSAVVGTSGVIFAHTDRPNIDSQGRLHSFCHAVPGKWHVMGVTLAAGGSLRWYRDAFAAKEKEIAGLLQQDAYEIIDRMALAVPAGSDGLFFLPYLSGERTPHPDPNARGVFFGLSLRHNRAHLARAIMEGVAFSLRDCLELIREIDVEVGEVRISGGGGKSPLWKQIMADILGMPIVSTNTGEGPSFGAALLAGVGGKVYEDVEEACRTTVRAVNTVPVHEPSRKLYDEYYQVYRELYPTLKGVFAKLNRLPGHNV